MGVHHDVGEFVMAADVVVVAVRGDCGDRLVEQVGHLLGEAHHAHSGVDDQVAVAALHVPDVAAHERNHVRFPQQRDAVVDGGTIEPAVRDRQRSHGSVLGFLARLGATLVGSPAIFG